MRYYTRGMILLPKRVDLHSKSLASPGGKRPELNNLNEDHQGDEKEQIVIIHKINYPMTLYLEVCACENA